MINSIKSQSVNHEMCETDRLFENLIWMTIKDAARYLRRSENAIRIAVHRGQITRYKWLGKLYFKKSDLDSMLESSAH